MIPEQLIPVDVYIEKEMKTIICTSSQEFAADTYKKHHDPSL